MQLLQFGADDGALWLDRIANVLSPILFLFALYVCYARFTADVKSLRVWPGEAQKSCLLWWALWLGIAAVFFFALRFAAGYFRDR